MTKAIGIMAQVDGEMARLVIEGVTGTRPERADSEHLRMVEVGLQWLVKEQKNRSS